MKIESEYLKLYIIQEITKLEEDEDFENTYMISAYYDVMNFIKGMEKIGEKNE